MNIFISDYCPRKAASYLDNKRVIKMILESAQLLSTALRELDKVPKPRYVRTDILGEEKELLDIYKSTHVNHPCSKWVRKDWANYWWLYRHYLYLLAEYRKRYGRTHKCARLRELLFPPVLKPEEPTEFVKCAADKYQDLDVRSAYQLYLNDKWDADKRPPEWTGPAEFAIDGLI